MNHKPQRGERVVGVGRKARPENLNPRLTPWANDIRPRQRAHPLMPTAGLYFSIASALIERRYNLKTAVVTQTLQVGILKAVPG